MPVFVFVRLFWVWLLLSPCVLWGDQVFQDFDSSLFSHSQYLASYDESFVSVVPGGMRYEWMHRGEAFPGSSFRSRFGLRGDFEIDFLFDVLYLGVPRSGWGSGVLLRLDFQDLASTGISLQRQVRTDGQHVVSLDETRYGLKEHSVRFVPFDPDHEISGFRVRRTGRQLDVIVLDREGDAAHQWRADVSGADVLPVGFHVHSGQAIADIDVVLRSFQIAADQILQREEIYFPYETVRLTIAFVSFCLLVVAVACRWFVS